MYVHAHHLRIAFLLVKLDTSFSFMRTKFRCCNSSSKWDTGSSTSPFALSYIQQTCVHSTWPPWRSHWDIFSPNMCGFFFFFWGRGGGVQPPAALRLFSWDDAQSIHVWRHTSRRRNQTSPRRAEAQRFSSAISKKKEQQRGKNKCAGRGWRASSSPRLCKLNHCHFIFKTATDMFKSVLYTRRRGVGRSGSPLEERTDIMKKSSLAYSSTARGHTHTHTRPTHPTPICYTASQFVSQLELLFFLFLHELKVTLSIQTDLRKKKKKIKTEYLW